VLGSVGWQDWSEFGQVQLGIDDTNNPTSTTKDLDFDDTWHAALGAQ
jgi:long-chain fatty acid transport protein